MFKLKVCVNITLKKPKVYLYFQENTFKMYLNHYLEQYAFNLGVERHTVIVL